MFDLASAPVDWASCHRLLQRFEAEELLCSAHAAAKMALPVWLAAVSVESQQQPASQAVDYLGDWLLDKNDGLNAHIIGDNVYRCVQASNLRAGTAGRAAALSAAHAVFALAFHLGLCRQHGPKKVESAVRDAIAQASIALNWHTNDFSRTWGKRWLEFTLEGIECRRARKRSITDIQA